MVAVLWWLRSEPTGSDLAVAPEDPAEARSSSALSTTVTPAQALAEGDWPGLPELRSDDRTGSATVFDAAQFDQMEPEAAIDPEILDQSVAGLLDAFDTLPEPQRAEVAVQIGQRLMSCFGYQPEPGQQMEARLRHEFQQQQKHSESLAAILGPDAAEQWIAELVATDEDQWVASRIAERQRLREQCDGIEQNSRALPRS